MVLHGFLLSCISGPADCLEVVNRITLFIFLTTLSLWLPIWFHGHGPPPSPGP